MAGYAGEAVQVFAGSDPADPHWVATIPVGAQSLATAGKYVYLATWEGLEIWHVAMPTQPERSSAIAITGGALSVWLHNSAQVRLSPENLTSGSDPSPRGRSFTRQ